MAILKKVDFMKTVLLCSVLFLLAACNKPFGMPPAAEPSIEGSATPMLQCHKDTDCKGDRICEKGSCTSPSSPSVPSPVKALTQSDIDACAMKKIDAYRAEVGPDENGDEAIVATAMVEEWEDECKAGK